MMQPDDIMSDDSNDSSGRSSMNSMYRASVVRAESNLWKPPEINRLDDDLVDESLCTVNTNDDGGDLINMHSHGDQKLETTKDEDEEPVYEVLYRNWEPKPEDCIVDVELNDGTELSIDYDAYERIKRTEAKKQQRRANIITFLCYSTLAVLFIVCAGVTIGIIYHEGSAGDEVTNQQSQNIAVSFRMFLHDNASQLYLAQLFPTCLFSVVY